MFDTTCKNILVRGVNWIGDSVMILPSLRALKEVVPKNKISLLIKPWVSPIFERNPNIDEIILYDDTHKGFLGKLKLSRLLNKKSFCSTILFQNAFDAALIAFLARIPERAGYNRDGRGFLLTTKVPVTENILKIHHIFYYLNLLKHIGLNAEYSRPYIYLADTERFYARDLLKDMKRPILGINPGATYGSAKRWLPERFAEVANWFIKDTGGSIVIFSGKNEIDIAQEIDKRILDNKLFLAGKTSLRDLIALISECDVFVTNDSGPLHISYAVRTPLVAIFGSTDPQLTGPPTDEHGMNHVVLSPDLPCSPCFERTCRNNDMQCMYEITSDDVYYGIKKVLPDKGAVFFDRDGTLCKDTGYLNTMNNLQIFPEVDQIALLAQKGFKCIGITNQSGIARKIVNEEFVKEVNNIFINTYGFDDFYYCPHHPDDRCPCRKPEPEMLLRAKLKHKIDLKKSYVVGDKEDDMLSAKTVGAKAVLVQTGEIQESQNSDFIAKNLTEAVKWILENEKSS